MADGDSVWWCKYCDFHWESDGDNSVCPDCGRDAKPTSVQPIAAMLVWACSRCNHSWPIGGDSACSKCGYEADPLKRSPVTKMFDNMLGIEQPLLSPEESEVIDLLAEASVRFGKLERIHPAHTNEFVLAIHAAQRIVMCRPVSRQIGPKDWKEKEKGEQTNEQR